MNRALVIIAVVVAAKPAAADGETPAQLYYRGQAAFDANHYDDAIAAWENSNALAPQPVLLFNLAQAYRLRGARGDCTKARADYKAFLAGQPSPEQRAIAEHFVVEIDACAQSEAKPAMDTPSPVASPLVPAPIMVAPVESSESRSWLSLAGVGTAIVGAGLFGTGVFYGHRASKLSGEVTDLCAQSCTFDDIQAKDSEGRSAQRLQYVFDGLGAAAIVAGGVMFWYGHTHADRPSPVGLLVTGDGAFATWRGGW